MTAVGLITAALAASGGCGVYPYWVPEGPEAYRDGYEDGCRAGAMVRWGGPGRIELKDKSRYREHPDYRVGWDEARTYCKENPVITPFVNEPGEPGGGATGGGIAPGK